jgi:formate dehydrogenase major subunit
VKPGTLYTTFHFPELMINRLTGHGHDPDTLCPEYKISAVDVEPVTAESLEPIRQREVEPVNA